MIAGIYRFIKKFNTIQYELLMYMYNIVDFHFVYLAFIL